MNAQFIELKKRLNEIADLNKIGQVLSWDQQTMMAPQGSNARAEQMSTLGRIAHEKFTSAEIGRLLDDLRDYEPGLPYDSDDASLIRITRQDYEKQKRVPSDLRAEMTRTAVFKMCIGQMAW